MIAYDRTSGGFGYGPRGSGVSDAGYRRPHASTRQQMFLWAKDFGTFD